MHAPALLRLAELLLAVPVVGTVARTRSCASAPRSSRSWRRAGRLQVRQPWYATRVQNSRPGRRQVHRVGDQQLIVAERRRQGFCAGARVQQAGLQIISTAAAGLERIKAHRKIARHPFSGDRLRVGAVESLSLARWGVNSKYFCADASISGIVGTYFISAARRRLVRRRRINRPRRPIVDRRLRQHVVIERDLMTATPLALARAPLLGDLVQ